MKKLLSISIEDIQSKFNELISSIHRTLALSSGDESMHDELDSYSDKLSILYGLNRLDEIRSNEGIKLDQGSINKVQYLYGSAVTFILNNRNSVESSGSENMYDPKLFKKELSVITKFKTFLLTMSGKKLSKDYRKKLSELIIKTLYSHSTFVESQCEDSTNQDSADELTSDSKSADSSSKDMVQTPPQSPKRNDQSRKEDDTKPKEKGSSYPFTPTGQRTQPKLPNRPEKKFKTMGKINSIKSTVYESIDILTQAHILLDWLCDDESTGWIDAIISCSKQTIVLLEPISRLRDYHLPNDDQKATALAQLHFSIVQLSPSINQSEKVEAAFSGEKFNKSFLGDDYINKKRFIELGEKLKSDFDNMEKKNVYFGMLTNHYLRLFEGLFSSPNQESFSIIDTTTSSLSLNYFNRLFALLNPNPPLTLQDYQTLYKKHFSKIQKQKLDKGDSDPVKISDGLTTGEVSKTLWPEAQSEPGFSLYWMAMGAASLTAFVVVSYAIYCLNHYLNQPSQSEIDEQIQEKTKEAFGALNEFFQPENSDL